MNTSLHNRITRPLLYQSVIQKLLEMVEQSEISPGDPFPPERELVLRWGISRNVLREAFHVLSERGIIHSIQGKGRFLRTLPDQEIAQEGIIFAMERDSLTEIYEVRLCLELLALDRAVKTASDQEIEKLEKKFEEIKRLFIKTQKVVREFELHLGYAALSGNFMLEQMVNTTIKLISDFMNSSFTGVLEKHRVDDYIREHSLIIGYIKQRNAQKAKEAMEDHFNRTISWIKPAEGSETAK